MGPFLVGGTVLSVGLSLGGPSGMPSTRLVTWVRASSALWLGRKASSTAPTGSSPPWLCRSSAVSWACCFTIGLSRLLAREEWV